MDTVRYGDRGPMTAYLQLALRRAGYDPGAIDGIFGTRTLDALTRFQRANGLSADGIAGRLTWTALYPYLAGYTVVVAQAGDTFSRLADRFGTSVSAIVTANPRVVAENIPIGAELTVPLGFSVVPDNVPYSFALNTVLIDGLTARYPFIRTETIGSSVMGRPLEALSIGTGETQVFYNASHHANEWITSLVLMDYLERYAESYVSELDIYDRSAQTLYEETTLYMVPLVNPDGVDLVTGALSRTDSYYRQAEAMAGYYPSIPFPSGWKANIRGVDLNLGYPAGWEEARRIKFAAGYTRPGPRDFVDSAPLAEPENRAMADFTEAHDFSLTLSYHTQGEVIYWKYLDYNPPRAYEIAVAFADASGYLTEETPYASGFAGYKDWFIQTYNRPGYTIEAGAGENPLPLAQLSQINRDNLGILTLGMELA